MRLTIIFVGQLKEKHFADAAAEYEKRLGKFCEIKRISVKESKIDDKKSSDAEITAALAAEAAEIKAQIPKKSKIFTLCIEGEKYTSENFAALLDKTAAEASSICFIIGSSRGLADELKAMSVRLSMSDMTFPHQLAQVMLLEQLYRAFAINSNIKYHK